MDAVTAASDKNKDKQGVSVSMSVEVHGPAVPAGDQLQRCTDSLRGLLPTDTEGNAFCNEVYSGEFDKQGCHHNEHSCDAVVCLQCNVMVASTSTSPHLFSLHTSPLLPPRPVLLQASAA